MRSRLLRSALLGAAALGAISLAGAGVAQADIVNWVFYNHGGGGTVITGGSGGTIIDGTSGTPSVTFASTPALTPAQTVTLTPFGPNSPYLFQKNGLYPTTTGIQPGEQGIGLTNDPTGQDEISAAASVNPAGNPSFVQVDIRGLASPPLNTLNLGFSMGSLPGGDMWAVYGSNTDGSFIMDTAHRLAAGGTFTGTLSNVIGAWNYLDVVSTNNNVLLSTLSATVPEPGSLALLGTGLLGLGLVARRRRRRKA